MTAACCSGAGGGAEAGFGGAGFGGSGLVSFLVSGAGGVFGLSSGLPSLSTFGAAVMSAKVASSMVGGASSTSGSKKDGTPSTINNASSTWNTSEAMMPPVIG